MIALIDSNDKKRVEYKYDAWGRMLSKTGTMASTLGTLNPFRYRGYVYNEETGLYYLRSRYYNPEWARFLNADSSDTLDISTSPLVSTNVYAYCSNNPVGRSDEEGGFWFQVFVGLAVQYVSDVVGNIIDGKTGLDIFAPTSSFGEYVAAGITAVLPGSGLVRDLVGNVITEGIVIAEKSIKGKDIDWGESAVRVVSSTMADQVFGAVSNRLTEEIKKTAPRNYSSYAGKMYKKYPKITRPQIEKKLCFSAKMHQLAVNSVDFTLSVTKNVTMSYLLP